MNETPLADAKDGVLEAVERGELIPVDLLGRQEFAPALPQTQVLLLYWPRRAVIRKRSASGPGAVPEGVRAALGRSALGPLAEADAGPSEAAEMPRWTSKPEEMT